ncbi:hypothetical protein N9W89_04175 [Hellea sp.]|nr:hypothetical protein [Hellea sp.]
MISISYHADLIAALKPAFISLIIGFSLSSLMVLYATRGRHPGWIVLLIITVLTGLAIRV